MVFEQPHSIYGKGMLICSGQFGMNIVIQVVVAVMVLKHCEPFCVCCEYGVILFTCDVKWVDSCRKKPPYRGSKFEKLSYGLMIATMD